MNLALASIILASPDGFIRAAELPAIIAADRLCWLLVRCDGCRFQCPAQDLDHLLQCVAAGRERLRDVSFPASLIFEADTYLGANRPPPPKLKTAAALRAQDFDAMK